MSFFPAKLTYRSDINGLRAWAVLSVVLFHFLVPGFAGGFAGVDIFFVISGYLMTGIIVSGLHDRQFGFGRFMLARAVRILPALIVLILVLLVMGWFLLPTPDYQALAGQGRYALIFWSNVDFAASAGYFSAQAHETWLLHTWSLSVEWQFYLLFPLLLMAVSKLFSPRLGVLFGTVLGLFVLSLAYNFYISLADPVAAFYLLPGRAWEMCAGGLVYFIANSTFGERLQCQGLRNRVMQWAGWAMLAITFVLLDDAVIWPGAWALLPVVGTMLVLLAYNEKSVLITGRWAQWLGDRSYSIYLWHWPVAVLLFFADLLEHTGWVVTGIALSILFGALSYSWVEEPTRRAFKHKTVRTKFTTVVTGFAVCAVCVMVVREVEFAERLDSDVEIIAAEAFNRNPLHEQCSHSRSDMVEECRYGGDELGVLVFGDSHAASVVRSVEAALPSEFLHARDLSMTACPVAEGIQHAQRPGHRFLCPEFVDSVLERSDDWPADVPLLIVNRASHYVHSDTDDGTAEYFVSEQPLPVDDASHQQSITNAMMQTACEIAQDRPVYWLTPIPEMPVDVPQYMSRTQLFVGQASRVSQSLQDYESAHAAVLAAQAEAQSCGVEILDVRPYLCSDGTCWGDSDGLPIYFDEQHLNERGGALLQPLFREMFSAS
ncbi:MAG: acyltransferase [Idiomarina sp.]|nr:acyltransferase [Idiomarina sp.]